MLVTKLVAGTYKKTATSPSTITTRIKNYVNEKRLHILSSLTDEIKNEITCRYSYLKANELFNKIKIKMSVWLTSLSFVIMNSYLYAEEVNGNQSSPPAYLTWPVISNIAKNPMGWGLNGLITLLGVLFVFRPVNKLSKDIRLAFKQEFGKTHSNKSIEVGFRNKLQKVISVLDALENTLIEKKNIKVPEKEKLLINALHEISKEITKSEVEGSIGGDSYKIVKCNKEGKTNYKVTKISDNEKYLIVETPDVNEIIKQNEFKKSKAKQVFIQELLSQINNTYYTLDKLIEILRSYLVNNRLAKNQHFDELDYVHISDIYKDEVMVDFFKNIVDMKEQINTILNIFIASGLFGSLIGFGFMAESTGNGDGADVFTSLPVALFGMGLSLIYFVYIQFRNLYRFKPSIKYIESHIASIRREILRRRLLRIRGLIYDSDKNN